MMGSMRTFVTDGLTDIVWVGDDEIVEIAMSPSFSSLVRVATNFAKVNSLTFP